MTIQTIPEYRERQAHLAAAAILRPSAASTSLATAPTARYSIAIYGKRAAVVLRIPYNGDSGAEFTASASSAIGFPEAGFHRPRRRLFFGALHRSLHIAKAPQIRPAPPISIGAGFTGPPYGPDRPLV